MGKTLFDKVWDAHTVRQLDGGRSVLYIDRHYIHEVTSPVAFLGLRNRGIKVARPDRTTGTPDHNVPTVDQDKPVAEEQSRMQLESFGRNCEANGVEYFKLGSPRHGVVHIVGPELGITQPGMTIVCGGFRRRRIRHGYVGGRDGFRLAVYPAAQTQDDAHYRRRTARPGRDGQGHRPVRHIPDFRFGRHGPFHRVRRRGDPGLVDGGADDLYSDPDARFDTEYRFDAADIEPMITYGTNPGMGVGITGTIPSDEGLSGSDRVSFSKALAYMDFRSGEPMLGKRVDYVFLGSCTNGRIEDFRQFAHAVKGRRKAPHVTAWLVPGSKGVEAQARAEGLDKILAEAGFELRQPGCSACLAMNADKIPAGMYSVSTSNRNFEGRQGPGARTMLAGPLVAAAAAVTGCVSDPREVFGL